MARLTVGLIGCGSIAASAHVPALQRLTALVRVRNVCDIRSDNAERIAGSLGATFTTDYRTLLDDPQIDAVVITTPEFLPQYRRQLEQTQTLINQADRNGHQRLAEMNRTVEKNLLAIITAAR